MFIIDRLGLSIVPVLQSGIYKKEWATVDDLLKYAETIEYYPGYPAEGIVIKSDLTKKEKRISFKAVSNKYLMLTHTQPCLLYTSPSPRDLSTTRMPSSA
eukprot:TRINITY_DN11389_c0_g1_i1.p2 TRINITY_DN11389_c0_g1~~TRINITY_DN11389_c0_g1_i1.p2  ORF type:complete len:109 (+),score=41.26 TRINITY_DN11389_c0_g1_i1:30-329(+)